MKYFLVAGEASGDLHASNLMRELLKNDPQAEFRYFGGDCMAAVGGTLLKHYRDMAFMGIVDVLMHARTVLGNLKSCKQAVRDWNPDALILVDYASFNLKIAAFVKENLPELTVHFYISPKIWAWKEYRIKAFRAYIDRLYVILPFETAFFAKHHYPVEYVGNPCVDSVAEYLDTPFDEATFRAENALDARPVLALLPGSRTGEIRRNLPLMSEVAKRFPDFQFVVAGAPGQDKALYASLIGDEVPVLFGQTYSLVRIAKAAMVTSGTATLEVALLNTPQVVCYEGGGIPFPNWVFKHIMHVPYFSLVNLIAGKAVVQELLGKYFTEASLHAAIAPLLTDSPEREITLKGYAEVRVLLGEPGASSRAARAIVKNSANVITPLR